MTSARHRPDSTGRCTIRSQANLTASSNSRAGSGCDELLLRQAFVSPIPADDFEKVVRAQARRPVSAVDDEPF